MKVDAFLDVLTALFCVCILVTSSVSLHPGLQGGSSASYSSQENTVAAIVQRAAAEAAARSSRQSSVDVARQPLQLPVSSLGQVPNSFCWLLSFCDVQHL